MLCNRKRRGIWIELYRYMVRMSECEKVAMTVWWIRMDYGIRIFTTLFYCHIAMDPWCETTKILFACPVPLHDEYANNILTKWNLWLASVNCNECRLIISVVFMAWAHLCNWHSKIASWLILKQLSMTFGHSMAVDSISNSLEVV